MHLIGTGPFHMEGWRLGVSSRLLTGSVPAIPGRRFDPVTFRFGRYAPMGVHLVSKTGTSAARRAGVRILYFPRDGVSNGRCIRPVKPESSDMGGFESPGVNQLHKPD